MNWKNYHLLSRILDLNWPIMSYHMSTLILIIPRTKSTGELIICVCVAWLGLAQLWRISWSSFQRIQNFNEFESRLFRILLNIHLKYASGVCYKWKSKHNTTCSKIKRQKHLITPWVRERSRRRPVGTHNHKECIMTWWSPMLLQLSSNLISRARSPSLWATHLHIRTSAHEIILDLCAKCVCVFQLVKIYVKGFLYLIKMLIGAN